MRPEGSDSLNRNDSLDGNAGLCRDRSCIPHSLRDETGLQMLDQTILLREDSFETSEAVHEIQLAISRNGFIEMKDESWTKRDVLYVHDRTVGSHFLENVVQSVCAGIHLAQRFEVVHARPPGQTPTST